MKRHYFKVDFLRACAGSVKRNISPEDYGEVVRLAEKRGYWRGFYVWSDSVWRLVECSYK